MVYTKNALNDLLHTQSLHGCVEPPSIPHSILRISRLEGRSYRVYMWQDVTLYTVFHIPCILLSHIAMKLKVWESWPVQTLHSPLQPSLVLVGQYGQVCAIKIVTELLQDSFSQCNVM